MADKSYLNWPFLDRRHRDLANKLRRWAADHVAATDESDVDNTCRSLVDSLAANGWLDFAVPVDGHFDLRSLCLIRETLAYQSALADFAFAMQGLGTGAVTLFGSHGQRSKWLSAARSGSSLAAFALSEPDAGSDVVAMTTHLTEVKGGFALNGIKTWISNGGIANQYVVFARDGDRHTAVILRAETPGLEISERIKTIAPHPMATIRFKDCIVNEDAIVGGRGNGIRVALGTLDIFRPSVGAAALGLARRAFDEARHRASERRMFNGVLGDLQLTQAKLADMAVKIDAAALLVYRAAWMKDVGGAERITAEAAMAKLYATEAAQEIIDDALQLWGAAGVTVGSKLESLYRDIRAMRIYEGASEVQKIVIARAVRETE